MGLGSLSTNCQLPTSFEVDALTLKLKSRQAAKAIVLILIVVVFMIFILDVLLNLLINNQVT